MMHSQYALTDRDESQIMTLIGHTPLACAPIYRHVKGALNVKAFDRLKGANGRP